MKLRELTPMLRTKDLRGTVEFYTRTLGFECDELSEEWVGLRFTGTVWQ